MLGRVRKKQKISGQQDFCHKNFPVKTRKLPQFSNSRQIPLKVCLQILSITMVQICSIWCIYKRSRSPRHIFRLSGLFLDYPDTFSRLSGHFQDHPETFHIIQIHFLDYPYTLCIIWKLFSSSGHFLHRPETFQFIWTLCILSGYFVQYLDIFQNIRKFFSQ